MYIKKNKILLFILSIILFNLYFPHAVGATFIDTLSPAQRKALQKASDADEDVQELIDYAPDLLDLNYIYDEYLINTYVAEYGPGDANGDYKVDLKDYIIWLKYYKQTNPVQQNENPDFNNDGLVNGIDFIIWSVNYNKNYPTPTSTPTSTQTPTRTPTPTPIPTLSPLPYRPNIVLIVSDDQRYESLEKMPFMGQRLGTGYWNLFTNAYDNVALCCPSRSTILSGLYSHHTGVEDNNKMRLFNENDNLATKLNASGYHTGLIGKYLNKWIDGRTPYTPPGWDTFQAFVVPDYYNYEIYRASGEITKYGVSASDYSTDVVGQKAVDYLKNVKEPFFLYFAPYSTHYPYKPAPRHLNADVGEISFNPSFNEADVSDKPTWVKNLPLRDPLLMEENLTAQYRMGLSLDEWIEKMNTTLLDRNILSRTIIIYISDNAHSWGEHRHVAKVCEYDSCNHILLLVRYPFRGGRKISNLVTNVDIAPTIAEIAGITLQNPDGKSLLPLLNGTGNLGRTGLLIRWGGYGFGITNFNGIIKPNWKYVELINGERELYDRNNDPYELNNVAYKPEYAQLIQQLHNELIGLLNQ